MTDLADGLFVVDPDTNEDVFIPYKDIDEELLPKIFKPVGGFCYPANEFMQLGLADVPFYIKSWLPKPGKLLLYGQGKAGKSYVAQQTARCIGVGVPLFGIPTTRGRVLYIQCEFGAAIMQDRLHQTRQSYNNVYVGTTFSMKLDNKTGVEQLETAIKAIKPNVVILDPFYKLLSGDEKESHDVLIIFDNLDKIIENYNCSFILIHHAGKDLTKLSRGSSVFGDWPDACIEMKRVGKEIKLTPKLLRHAELPPDPIELVMENFEFKVVGANTVKERIHEFIAKHGQAETGDLLDFGSRRSIHYALAELENERTIIKKGRGTYEYNEKGEGNG